MKLCAACGHGNSPLHKFCSECGAALTRDPAEDSASAATEERSGSDEDLDGERKQVSVLFADIKGSLELLADRDPEDSNRLLDAVLHLMMDAVHSYKGTVSQARGDGVMAIFGAPLAQEDHAARACFAALRLQQMVEAMAADPRRSQGIPVQVRIGINSGEVVVRAIRNDVYMEYTAVGQSVHLAARMEQMAPAGKVYATEHTVRLAERFLSTQSLGRMPVRGLPEPVEVFEIIGMDPQGAQLPMVPRRGLTPFVGRADAIEILRGALLDAESGLGQVVNVVGEAGVGKTRLVHEFVQMAENVEWRVVESAMGSAAQGRSFATAIELLKSDFGIAASDTPEAVRERIGARLLRSDEFTPEDLPPLLDLLDLLPPEHLYLQTDPDQRRRAVLDVVVRLFIYESQAAPLVLILENIDRSDALSQQLLTQIQAHSENERVLVLVTQRPGHPELPPPSQTLRLKPLPPRRFSEFLDALLGGAPSILPVKPFLRQHGGGNPFVTEEIVRTLRETGVLDGAPGAFELRAPLPEFQVPPTVQALLAARIDRLPPDEKRVLQNAAVIGTQVPLGLLCAVTELSANRLHPLLQNLVEAQMLIEVQTAGETEYAFRHALTHEVAYAELLRARRRAIHARTALAIERQQSHRLGEWLERLAEHAWQGALWAQAVNWLRQAGQRAFERQAHAQAIPWLERALETLEQLPRDATTRALGIDLRLELVNALQLMGEPVRVMQLMVEARGLAEQDGDVRRLGWVHCYLTDAHRLLGQPEEAVAAGERALTLGREADDLGLQAVTNLPLGLLYHSMGDYRRAIGYFDWNMRRLQGPLLRQRLGLAVLPAIFSRAFLAWSHAELGQFSQAHGVIEDAQRIATETQHAFSLGYTHLCAGVVHLRQGEAVLAVLELQRALSTTGFGGSMASRAHVSCHLGHALVLAERLDEGLELLERDVAVWDANGIAARHALRLAYLADACLRAGRPQQADALADRGLHLARNQHERAHEVELLRVLGECAWARDSHEEARQRFQAAMELAEQLGMQPQVALCHDGLARSFEGLGDSAQAATQQRAARGLFTRMEMVPPAPPRPAGGPTPGLLVRSSRRH